MLNLHIYIDVYQYAKALSLFQLANDLQVIEMSYFTPNFYPEKKMSMVFDSQYFDQIDLN